MRSTWGISMRDLELARSILMLFGAQQPKGTSLKISIFVAISFVLIIYEGFNPFYFYWFELITLALIFGFAYLILITDFFVGLEVFAIVIMIGFPFFIQQVERFLRHHSITHNEYVRIDKNANVVLSLSEDNYFIYAAVTNKTDSWMGSYVLNCKLPTKVPWRDDLIKEINVRPKGWMKAGETFRSSIFMFDDVKDYRYDMDFDKFTCKMGRVDFYRDIKLKPEIEYKIHGTGYRFRVMNKTSKTLTKINFSCMIVNISANGKPRERRNIEVSPMKGGMYYEIKPGEEGYFESLGVFVSGSINGLCDVLGVKWV